MRVRINGVQIGFEDIGQGPVVLFIHDYLLDRQMWRPQVDPLVAAGFRVILADLRGCGESEQTKEPVAIKTYSADIIGLLDYLGIGRAAVCELSFAGSVLGMELGTPAKVFFWVVVAASWVVGIRGLLQRRRARAAADGIGY